jgi:hypothetical protein
MYGAAYVDSPATGLAGGGGGAALTAREVQVLLPTGFDGEEQRGPLSDG